MIEYGFWMIWVPWETILEGLSVKRTVVWVPTWTATTGMAVVQKK
jgi:hypothetical protein